MQIYPQKDRLSTIIIAAQNGRWTEVLEYLQTLPIIELSDNSLALVLDLAMQVLIQGDFEEQWEIAKIIPKLGEIAIQPLLDRINDSSIDLEDRWFIARILGGFREERVITALIEIIKQNEDPDLVEIATGSLAKIGISTIPALTNLLNPPVGTDPILEYRIAAITALAQIRHSQTIEPLIQMVDDLNPQMRTLIIEALSSFHDVRIPPILLDKLTDSSATVRKAAVTGLCLRSELSTELNLLQHLRPLLFDLNLAVCEATALGLSRFTDPAVVEILLELSIDPLTPVRLKSQTILALGWIDTESAISSLGQILRVSPPDLAVEVICSLGKTAKFRNQASELLVNYLHGQQHPAKIKQEIAAAFGNLGNISTISDLTQLSDDLDDRVKFQAIAAINKLTSSAINCDTIPR